MSSVTNVNFHQTFKPESQYISSILSIADNNDGLSLREISQLTGIPQGESSGKVEPHIVYSSSRRFICSRLWFRLRTEVSQSSIHWCSRTGIKF